MGTELILLELVGLEAPEIAVEVDPLDHDRPGRDGAERRAPHIATPHIVTAARLGRPSSPLEAFLVAVLGTGGPLVLGFLVVLGFVGGAVPVLGWELGGGLWSGLAWLALLGAVPAALLVAVLVLSAVVRRLPPLRADERQPLGAGEDRPEADDLAG